MMGFDDFLWFLVFGLVGLSAVAYSLRRYGYWFTPVSVFIGINCASICTYHLRLLDMNDVSLVTHLIVLTALMAFTWGTHVAGSPGGEPPRDWVVPPVDAVRLSQFFHLTALLATVGWLIAATILISRHGLAFLIGNLWFLQSGFQMKFIGYLNLLGILVLPAWVLLVRVRGFRWVTLLLALSAVFGLLLAGIKAYLIYSVLMAMACWSVVAPRQFRPRILALGLFVLLGFFVAYNQVIDVFVYEIHTGSGPFARLTALHRPYVYFTGAWPAMDRLVHGQAEVGGRFGATVLEPLWKVLGEGLGLVESESPVLPFTDIGTTLFNVYSFFGEVYRDGRWPLVLALSWLLGWLGTRQYLLARRSAYWGHTLVYALIAHALFLSCFAYLFLFHIAFMALYTYALGFVILRGGVLVDRRHRD
jgi:oligosaccharide repeat unit polymerase